MLAFQKKQYEFARHLRDPDNTPAPEGLEDRRMKVYRDLFFGNIKGLVSQTFPVLRKFYNDTQWNELIRKFMIEHEAQTPLFLEVSSEFIHYLQNTYQRNEQDPVFMLELAHYEWAELAVAVMDAEPEHDQINPAGDLLEARPYLSPTVWSLAYEFPVHQISPDYAPNEKPELPTYLLIFRKLDDSVEFMELNAVSARLLNLLEEDNTRTGREILSQIASEMQHPNPDTVIENGNMLLNELRDKEIILGTFK